MENAIASSSLLQYKSNDLDFSTNDDEPIKNSRSFQTKVYSRSKGKYTIISPVETSKIEHCGFANSANILEEPSVVEDIEATYSDDSSNDDFDCSDPKYIDDEFIEDAGQDSIQDI